MTTTNTCPRSWCRGRDGGYDCEAAGHHSWRPWRYDADGLFVEVDAIAYTTTPPAVEEPMMLLLTVENVEVPEKVTQSVSLDELDGLIAMLSKARGDLARALTYDAPESWVPDDLSGL